jgi:hypothetical protein
MVNGSKAHADALWDEVSAVLAPLGLRLSAALSAHGSAAVFVDEAATLGVGELRGGCW